MSDGNVYRQSSLKYPRIATVPYSKVLSQGYFEHGTGDAVGSLICAFQLNQIKVTYPRDDHMDRISALFDKIDDESGDEQEHGRALMLDSVRELLIYY